MSIRIERLKDTCFCYFDVYSMHPGLQKKTWIHTETEVSAATLKYAKKNV